MSSIGLPVRTDMPTPWNAAVIFSGSVENISFARGSSESLVPGVSMAGRMPRYSAWSVTV